MSDRMCPCNGEEPELPGLARPSRTPRTPGPFPNLRLVTASKVAQGRPRSRQTSRVPSLQMGARWSSTAGEVKVTVVKVEEPAEEAPASAAPPAPALVMPVQSEGRGLQPAASPGAHSSMQAASRPSVAIGPPAAKRRAITTDLSDRHIQLCAQDAILAVHQRVVG